MIAVGGAGGLLSTTPLAAVAETLGWRVAFLGRSRADGGGSHRHLRAGAGSPLVREKRGGNPPRGWARA